VSDASHWEGNLRIIRAHYPRLAEELERPGPAGEDLRVETAASGDPTLVVGGIHIHSPRDPVREGRRLAESLTGEGPLIVLGFGLGYAPEAAAEKNAGRPLLIVERRRAVLRRALEFRNLANLLAEHKLIFVLGRDDGEDGPAVTAALDLLGASGAPELLKNRALISLDESWYTGVEQRIRTWFSRDDINTATLERFGKRWVRNLTVNRWAIRDLPGIARLAGMIDPAGPSSAASSSAVPVFLAAAGPSLDEIGPYLPAVRERCLLIAVDTSLRFLLKAGAEPDFTVAVDPQYWNVRHLDRAAAPGSCLIAESAVYPPVLRGFSPGGAGKIFKRAFLCSSLFPLGRFIEDRLDPKGVLGAGGSVATTAWDFARILGAGTIWIAGLDLAFPGYKTHFSGALFEERALAEGGRLVPAETRSVRALREGRPFRAPAAGGGTVLTDRRLTLYSAWFENNFRKYPAVRNYSLSADGLAIPGLERASVGGLLALPPRRDEIDRLLETVFSRAEAEFYAPGSVRDRADRYAAALGTLLEGLEQIRALAEDAAAAAEGALRDGAALSPARSRLLKKLDNVNRAITSSEVKDVAGFLFPPLEEPAGLPAEMPAEALAEMPAEIPAASSGDAFTRYLALSAKLYRSLAEAAGYNLRALKKRD
jgi:hypothetical protein